MGTIVAENGIVEVSAVATALVDELPDDIFVLPQPRVHGVELEWLVVAATGIYHLDVRDWEGDVRAYGADEWVVRPSLGPAVKVESPLKRWREALQAMTAFLTDECPDADFFFSGLLVFPGPTPSIAGLGPELAVLGIHDAIDRILNPAGKTVAALETREARQELAQALLDRQLTLRQRASRPFVFSVGGALRAKLSARSIEQLFKLLDRYPRAGVRHLLDGSLVKWFEQEGAHHLAKQAQSSLQRLTTDGRAALENFMTGSGYVKLPRSRVRPRQLQVGYVTPRDGARLTLQVERSRGRGYVHGHASSPDTWVRVEPSQFSGNCRFTITIDPSNLPVGHDSCSSVLISSDVGGSDHAVPLTARVRPTPAPIVRRLFRPSLGLLTGALLGGLAGLLWTRSLARHGQASGLETVLLLAVVTLWGVLGAVRGVHQAAAWPTPYALGKWALRVLGWAVMMGATVFGLLGLALALMPTATKIAAMLARGQPMLAALAALAVLPGTLDDIAHARAMQGSATIELRQRVQRRAVRAGVGLAVTLALILGIWQVRPLYVEARSSEVAHNIQRRADNAWRTAQSKLTSYVDGLFVRVREETKPGRMSEVDQVLDWLGLK